MKSKVFRAINERPIKVFTLLCSYRKPNHSMKYRIYRNILYNFSVQLSLAACIYIQYQLKNLFVVQNRFGPGPKWPGLVQIIMAWTKNDFPLLTFAFWPVPKRFGSAQMGLKKKANTYKWNQHRVLVQQGHQWSHFAEDLLLFLLLVVVAAFLLNWQGSMSACQPR